MKPRLTMAALICAAFLALIACSGTEHTADGVHEAHGGDDTHSADRSDWHSFARPEHAKVTHMELDWDILFDEEALEGTVILHIERGDHAPNELRLDTKGLTISEVKAGTAGGEMTETTWRLADPVEHLGAEMVVDLPDTHADRVSISYRSSPGASGLQWLSKEQTTGGKQPFLYTQSQAIHARTWIPCQDSPAVRVTFDAKVRADRPVTIVMAADRVSEKNGEFTFTMPHSIPSYLIALGAGDLVFGEVGPRTGVWAEPAVLKAAVDEFADMEAMLEATEPLYGPYRWSRYDILVLPPSFPFGGMENPMLTFATPTILAGDRSLVSLVAHELAHSWSGNLVTNATWSDFWLNEGFTVYLERRIMEEVFGEARADMEWMLGRQDLMQDINENLKDKPGDQVLEIDLTGRDPDDGFTNIAYEKGALFLLAMEETYGRGEFDTILKEWFDGHAFESVTTDELRAYLKETLESKKTVAGAKAPDVEAWLTQPGLPDELPTIESDELAKVDAQLARWKAEEGGASNLDTADWSTHHWRHFLRTLPGEMSPEQMTALDKAFGFTKTGNSEILEEWLVLSIRHEYDAAFDRLHEFLTTQGRRKFLTPLYKEMAKSEEGKKMALMIYAEARPMYHAISRRTLDPIVEWTETADASH